jgi:hypothetical protein
VSLFLVYLVGTWLRRFAFHRLLPKCLTCQQSSDTASRGRTLSSICNDVSAIHQSVGGSGSSECWRWALGRCSSSTLLGSDDFLIWYHCQSASDPFQSGVRPTCVLDRISRGRSRISSSGRSPDLEIGKTVISRVPHPMMYYDSREFQSADPLVPPLNLQCSLLPIGLVSDISRQDHLALSWNIVDDNVEDRLEIPRICFTECKHSAT